MFIFPLVKNNKTNPIYTAMAVSNLKRLQTFLDSAIVAATQLHHRKVTHDLIKALNYHAIVCLHEFPGEYRKSKARKLKNYQPPSANEVQGLMNDFVEDINQNIGVWDDLVLGAFALWKINWIHPFVEGNGRTARALCHYIVCAKNGGFSAKGPLPALIYKSYDDYIAALSEATRTGQLDPVVDYLKKIINRYPET